jgi:streptogramin lyase
MGGIIMGMRKKVLAISALWLTGMLASTGHAAGDVLLTGRITSASGENMEGVTVSARQFGKTFTTSVFTDAAGEYYFPRLEEGMYNIWAQAVGYEAAILEDASLNGLVHQQDLVLQTMPNFEIQLRGDEWMASLPEDTREDVKMKEVFRMTCYGGCHSPSHALKDRYDERSWKVILDMMMRQSSAGTYFTDEDRNVMPLLHYWKDELAAWLAKVRGPVPYPLELKPRPRPTGEETLAVFWEYDTNKPGNGVPLYNDGSLWELGPPNKTDVKNQGLLRATVDVEGNPWFSGGGNPHRSFGKIDWQTGKLTNYRVLSDSGQVTGGGELFGDATGVVWTHAAGKLVRVDPTGEMDLIEIPPIAEALSANRRAQSGADGQRRVWWHQRQPPTCMNGVCENPPNILWMYEPETQRFAAYENPPTPDGMNAFSDVYNVTSGGDNEGNGWWAQFGTDVMVKADGRNPGNVISIKIPRRQNPAWEYFDADDRRIFEMMGGPDPHGRGLPYQHTIRQVGAGPGPTDSAWGAGWWSSDLIRVNIRTHEVTVYEAPLPDCGPYHAVVDPQGYVWTVCHSADYLRRFDPRTEQWTRYDVPTLGIDAHGMGVAPVLINGRVRVVVPSWTTSKTILMEVRTEEDVEALKAEVQRANGAQ